MTLNFAYLFSTCHKCQWSSMLNKDDILTMKTNDNENFQKNKYYHKAQQRTFKHFINWFEGLPWWPSGKESTFQCRGCGFDPWSGN